MLAEKKPLDKGCAVELYPSDIPESILGWYFQDDLCRAENYQQLLEAKAKTPEWVRRAAMALWLKDGRYDALIAKVKRLKAMELAAEPAECFKIKPLPNL